MKHLIMGTAGHIDHGKTALVKALSGIDCDTHKQEKARGITINLGFAHLGLPSGDTLSIVDVPGHRNFVHTMVGGAVGIDFALMVVAADEGVMPQTREHLAIMQVLGVSDGVTALTKADLVDETTRELAAEEVRETAQGTFLEGRDILPVSSVTGEGIEELRGAIGSVAGRVRERDRGNVFRMYIDRIFTVAGFGTVVTGSVTGGRLGAEQPVWLLPGDRRLRVRRLERHGGEVPEIRAGDRASINLVGLERSDFRRGMVVADRPLKETRMVDGRLTLFEQGTSLKLWSQAQFLLGTYEAQGRIHLMDRDRLSGGESGLVQIHLPSPCVAQCGDRFVIRSSSSDRTLGGGEVLDSAPLHHRRRTERVVNQMSRIAEMKLPELVAAQVRKHPLGVGEATIAALLNVSAEEVRAVLQAEVPEDIVVRASDRGLFALSRLRWKKLRELILRRVRAHHSRFPLEEEGVTVDELCSKAGIEKGSDSEAGLRLELGAMAEEGLLREVKHTWALAGRCVEVGPELKRQTAFVEDFLRRADMRTPLLSELMKTAASEGIEESRVRQILRYLTAERKVYVEDGAYLHASVVDPCRKKLLTALAENPAGMTVAQFRDLVGGNRKICLLMYALFDREGITRREGDVRVITEKGRSEANCKVSGSKNKNGKSTMQDSGGKQ